MGCNTTQNEVGGKSLLLKLCVEKTFSTTDTEEDITITAHGLKVGDPLVFAADQIVGLTVIEANKPYFVKTVVDANTIQIALTPTGTAIVMDDTLAAKKVDAFIDVGGIRSKGITFTSEAVDITNQDSDEWTKLLDAAGVRSVALSGSGVYTNETTYLSLEEAAWSNLLKCLMFIDVKGLKVVWGCFKVTQVENSGDYNAEGSFTISAASSGEVFRYKAA